MTTKKVLGVASYSAVRSPNSDIVTLTAVGALPCMNYDAQLEKRPERVFPPMWNMVFFVQDFCLRAIKPFELAVKMNISAGGADAIIVHDATGTVHVPISDPFVPFDINSDTGEEDQYVVYARLPRQPGSYAGCIVVPEGTIVIAIYYKAYGPASKQECDQWMLKNCGFFERTRVGMFGGEVPWPGVVEE